MEKVILNGKSLLTPQTHCEQYSISALTLVFFSSRAPQVGRYSKPLCQEWPEISCILRCKDARSHDFSSIRILQLEVQLHNAVVRCIHFVCVHIFNS